MLDKKVSIIIPVYNVQEYIGECIESVIGQTYNNLEIIIADDGSQDDSLMICKRYAAEDERIRIFSQPNAGVSSARNLGLKNMTGEFVTFIDSDDWIDADYIEKLLAACEGDTDIVCCNTPDTLRNLPEVVTKSAEMAYVFSEFGYVWGKLIRANCIERLFNEEVCYAEDFLFYISNIRHLCKMRILDYEGYHYRIRVGSLSVKDKSEEHSLKEFQNKYTFVKGEKMLLDNIEQLDKEAIDIVKNHCFYVFTLLLLLVYRLHKIGQEVDTEEVAVIRKNMRRYYGEFFQITFLKRKNIKRFMFGTMLLLMPKIGGMVADKLLE